MKNGNSANRSALSIPIISSKRMAGLPSPLITDQTVAPRLATILGRLSVQRSTTAGA
jgi:hypothetical protein